MKITFKNIVKLIVGKKFISLYRNYSTVPFLLLNELHMILSLIKYKRKFGDSPEVLLSELRTQAHIVDKGLQTDDWEAGHSQEPYLQLICKINSIKESPLNTDPSYQWAVQTKVKYECAQKTGKTNSHSDERMHNKTTKYDLLELIRSRRSIRSFDGRPIPTKTLQELVEIVNWSPSSCNRQPTKLFVTQNADKIILCLDQCAGSTCFGKTIPCFIAVCADTRFYTITDRYLPFIDVSLGLQNMLLLAHAQGIEGTILNWFHHTSEEDIVIRKILAIPIYYSIIVNLVIGYSSNNASAPMRKSYNLTCQITD